MKSRFRVTSLALLLLTAVGCGSNGDGASTTPAPPPPTTALPAAAPTSTSPPAIEAASDSPSPGTVTLDVRGITGAQDLLLLGLLGRGTPIRAGAAVCQPVGTDPFSFTGALQPMTGDDPCTLGDEPMEFDPGSYKMVVAVIRGGSQSPEQCTEIDVTVDGDVTVEVAALGPPGDCSF